MNKKRKASIILVACFMVSVMFLQLSQVVTAVAADEVTVQVTNYEEFAQAVLEAKDGDVIGIAGEIQISPALNFKNGSKKHVTLKRTSASGYLNITFAEGQQQPTTFSGYTFDGGEIESIFSFIGVNNSVVFTDSIFKNSYSWSGAVNISSGEVRFTNCKFDNNKGAVGGHITANSGGSLFVDNCLLQNGYATAKGGAIAMGSTVITGTISSSIIKGNNADDTGGGIYNAGSLTITDSKIYENTATNSGADISNDEWGKIVLQDSLESLVKSFADDKLLPDGWIDESRPDELVTIPGNISGVCKLKLKYSVIEDKPDPEPTPDPLPKPDDKPKPDESKPVPAPITNNYYTDDHTRTTRTETTILPQPPETVKTVEPAKPQEQVIKIESNLQQDVPQIIDDGNGTITVNVNVTSDAEKSDVDEVQATSNITWIQMVIACLLFGILVCLIRRR